MGVTNFAFRLHRRRQSFLENFIRQDTSYDWVFGYESKTLWFELRGAHWLPGYLVHQKPTPRTWGDRCHTTHVNQCRLVSANLLIKLTYPCYCNYYFNADIACSFLSCKILPFKKKLQCFQQVFDGFKNSLAVACCEDHLTKYIVHTSVTATTSNWYLKQK